MKVLYKYYSDKFDVIEHLQNPAIKLATTASLNDPFEVQLSNGLASDLAHKLLVTLNKDVNKNQKVKSKIKESYKKISSGFGVISLTETHRNILMWAHYANSHKGVCIGYKTTFINDLNNREHHISDEWRGIYTPEKIRYDSKRFEHELDDDSTLIEKIMQAMLKKSDDWIYEKEHRCIVPFHMADRFKVNTKNNDLMSFITKKESHGYIQKIAESNDQYKCINEGDPRVFQMKQIAHKDDVLMLKDIAINSICSIFIGSNHCDKKTNLIIKEINSNRERYGHISVYKYHVHENDFKLYTVGLVNGKILTDINDMIIETNLGGFDYPKID